jgi:hypothetical protein
MNRTGTPLHLRRVRESRCGSSAKLLFSPFGALLFLAAAFGAGSADWHPGSAPLMTHWAAELNPTNVLPEYPRPQMVRSEWLNLNGLWDYAITPEHTEVSPAIFEGSLLVPFPVESALSGIMKQLDAKSTLWYRRHFALPASWAGRNLLLHFGAVDWAARVFVNGRLAGEHQGGYDTFTLDITSQLKPGEPQELVVAVSDPTEGDQPRGKQSRKPEGIFYTQVSGIWQTVWIEPVGGISISTLKLTPAVDEKSLQLRVEVSSLEEDLEVEAVATAAGAEVGRITGRPNRELTLPIHSLHLWTPRDPFLYDLTVLLKRADEKVDRVTSYFGMRKVGLRKQPDGFTGIELNGEPIFEVGALDQGFWPDGLYTAPTDEALRYDLKFLKSAGFNLVRKHVKVEPQRWYYWCDKLGLLVWQDMPSANNNTREGRAQFAAELQAMLSGLHNHPSIILWLLFNEGWGQYDSEQLVAWVKAADPSRLVDNASGWTDKQAGDVVDAHSYPEPETPAPEGSRASVLGEFGGLGLVIEGHTWPQPWAYQMLPDASSLQGWYSHLLGEMWLQRSRRGLCAAIYTQTSDVENECNGLLTYDRAVAKLAPGKLAQLNSGSEQRIPLRAVLPNALTEPALWKYTFEQPAGDWFKPGFKEDGKWREGRGGFGTAITRGAHVRTVWDGPDIWLRKEFVLGQEDPDRLKLQLHHDKDAEVFLNGVLAFQGKGYLVDYALFDILPEAAAALRPVRNLIAVHCRQTAGGQFIDVGIVTPVEATKQPSAGP